MLIKPKKSLGQNFLTDKKILNKIVDEVEINDNEILEIGPGTGNLTEFILKKKPKKIYVVEKDKQLTILLKNKFDNKINIINEDILKIYEDKISNDQLIVFGNLPYNISTEILCKWILNLKDVFWFKQLILMFQKEVAERIIADFNTSQYGRLSILSNWRLDIKKIFDIQPSSFYPKPKVESSLLIFTPKKEYFKFKDPKNLEIVTRVFFNERRKMLKKPFNKLFKNAIEVSNKLNIDLKLRPQNLDNNTYYNITQEYENLRS